MTQIQTEQPSKIFRGTVDEVFSRRGEIPSDATVELKIFAPALAEETPTMMLMRTWLEEDATDDPAQKEAAQQELDAFKRNMNRWREEAGARLLYPEGE